MTTQQEIKKDIKKMLSKQYAYFRAPAEFNRYKAMLNKVATEEFNKQYGKLQMEAKRQQQLIRMRMKK